MTLEQMLTGQARGMSNREYIAWRAFHAYRAAIQEREAEEARQEQARGRR